METNKKNNDCYFYYYSTCLKGDGCTFRHEPSALGSETVCSYWAQGKCMNVSCNFRHMELKKNRKNIPCYWESQPNGCQKSHCPFQHKTQREGVAVENEQSNDCDGVGVVKPLDRPDYRQRHSATGDGGESSEDRNRRLVQDFNTTTIDPVVVNFEEESDNESVPMSSPAKRVAVSRAQTMEEMHLERIQAESAAFYSYDDSLSYISPRHPDTSADFRVLSLAEIRSRSALENAVSTADAVVAGARRRVKPAAQIRAERAARERAHQYTDLDVAVDARDSLQGVKRKQVDVVQSSKKRAHSPIKFNIAQAEPSVTSYKIVKSELLAGDKKLFDDTTKKVKSNILGSKSNDGLLGEVKSINNDAKINIHSKPVKLKRQSKEVQSPASILIALTTNGSFSLKSSEDLACDVPETISKSAAENSVVLPGDNTKSEKQPLDTSVLQLHESQGENEMAVDNRQSEDVSSNLIQAKGCDIMEVGIILGEPNSNVLLSQTSVPGELSERVLLEMPCTSTPEVISSDRQESPVDEEMLLEDTNTEDDFLHGDIDALLED